MSNLARFLLRHPFTLALLMCLAMFAAFCNSHLLRFADDWRGWLGISPQDVVALHWHRMLTCLVVTAGQWKFVASRLMLVGRFLVSASQLPGNPSVVSADLAHLFALPLGWLMVRLGCFSRCD